MVALLGCSKSGQEGKAELPPPIVTVAPPVERMVIRYEYATGRVTPIESVDIQARVSGYLKKITFDQGSEVTKGKPLFIIDTEPFDADLAKAKAALETAQADVKTQEAEVVRAEAKKDTNKKDYDRAEEAYQKKSGAEQTRDIAKGLFDESVAAVLATKAKVILSKARVDEAKANLRTAELNRGYCDITAPISGLIGDKLVTEENLITGGQPNSTKLTSIVSVDKMDIAFDVDENTFQTLENAIKTGKIKLPDKIPCEAGLAIHGKEFPLKGWIIFADNKFDEKTGTRRMKARFDNPKIEIKSAADDPKSNEEKKQTRLLVAGMYARVRVPIGEPVKSMLVPESALASDQGMPFLYLVGDDKKTTRYNATLGVQDGEFRVIESIVIPGEGNKPRPLTLADKVIINGIMRVRPGMVVDPQPPKK
jgi:multidrug efflux system membrane fusion protein